MCFCLARPASSVRCIALITGFLLANPAGAQKDSGRSAAGQKGGSKSTASAQPPKPDEKLIGRLKEALKISNEGKSSAEGRAAYYHSAASQLAQLPPPPPPLPNAALLVFSRGLFHLRDSLLLQQMALGKEAAKQSVGKRLLLEDEAAQLKAAAYRIAGEIVEIGQIRDSLARNPARSAAADWKKSAATLGLREKSVLKESLRFAAVIRELEAEIEKARTPASTEPAAPKRDVKLRKPDASQNKTEASRKPGGSTDPHRQSRSDKGSACPFQGEWILDLGGSAINIELQLREKNGKPEGTYIKQGNSTTRYVLTGACEGDIEALEVEDWKLEIRRSGTGDLKVTSPFGWEYFGLPGSKDNTFKPKDPPSAR